MTSVTGSFTIPLDLVAAPEQLWPLFAELPLRKTWVRMPGPSSTATHDLDFRVGGGERMTNSFVHLSTADGVNDVKHLIGGTRLRLNGLVAAAAAAVATA